MIAKCLFYPKLDLAELRQAVTPILICEFSNFFQDTSSNFSDYVTVFIQSIIKLLADPHERVHSQAWEALTVVTASLDATEQQKHISSVRQALRYVRNDEVVLKTGTLPGFCLPKTVCEWFRLAEV